MNLISQLYPLHRSITGTGNRRTLELLQKLIPIEMHEVPTGTRAFEWEVPKEWQIRDAYIANMEGKRLVDYNESNLHVLSYSAPLHRTMSWDELKERLFTLPEHPDWIPYRTSYFNETWGFCISQNQFEVLAAQRERPYQVCIDSSLIDGYLTYGECLLPGETSEEVLFSCHICHPSLANDNLSGIAVATHLANYLAARERRYSYRFLFIPATIGAITWLSRNDKGTARVKHGLVLTLLGDPGHITYKKSRRGDAEIDRVVRYVLSQSGAEFEVREFSPIGYDERQFCSPGFNLPVGCLMRTPFGEFPEYHTSADDLDFVEPQALADSLKRCIEIIEALENNRLFINQSPKCEPRLGTRGLYTGFGHANDAQELQEAILWVLNFSDGNHDLLSIAERCGRDLNMLAVAANILCEHGLLEPVDAAAPDC